MSAGLEIERVWRPRTPPPGLEDGERVRQGYLAVEPERGTEARVRERGGRWTLTVKRGDGLVRAEHEVELAAADGNALWAMTDGRRVEKVRHDIELGEGLSAEVDVFSGELDGLVLVEVEFPGEAEARSFAAPEWFGTEVTDDPRYANRTLAADGAPL